MMKHMGCRYCTAGKESGREERGETSEVDEGRMARIMPRCLIIGDRTGLVTGLGVVVSDVRD